MKTESTGEGNATFAAGRIEDAAPGNRLGLRSSKNTRGIKCELDRSPLLQDLAAEDRYQCLVAKYEALSKQYRDLETRHRRCTRHIELANKKYREAKESARQWKAYHDRKHTKDSASERPVTPVSTVENARGMPILDSDSTPRARTTESNQHDTIVPGAGNRAHPATLARLQDKGQMMLQNQGDTGRPATITPSLRVSSSQTTEAGCDSPNMPSSPPANVPPSIDDQPVVVSSRSLKRKRSTPGSKPGLHIWIKQEAGSPEKPIEIKSEDFSSPARISRHPVRIETSDLDAFVDRLSTPRESSCGVRTSSEEVAKRPRWMSRVSSLSNTDILDCARRVTSVQNEEHQDQTPRSSSPEEQVFRETGVLQPISVNVPPDRRLVAKDKQSDQDAAAKAALLSEDGESQRVVASVRAPNTVEVKHLPDGKTRRLDTLLKEHTSNRHELNRNQTPDTTATRNRGLITPLSVPLSRNLQGSKHISKPQIPPSTRSDAETIQSSKSMPKKTLKKDIRAPAGSTPSPPPVRPEDEPLRLRPIEMLRLEDFRVNPQYMGGNYAYSETVRSREARRCLPGCSRPCCASLLKAAQMVPSLNPTRTDAEVLETYLGLDWPTVIGACTPDQRKQHLQQARAAAFANQYGKHRNVFERQSTPPGFWRTDMPSTQEEEEYRAQAHAMTRQQVAERWRDAVRGGGRWKFRDE
ncbi:hypothetical protein LTR62_001713 [Meristemomyces frigidus]|uniref:DNA endonuclease activator Ctp1 C-terminal domain-containing protein n=1 Tax=Meristemomyces frigidus TaxID=1508187 RepID=A0AAN7YG33_9PEZI|nr:hypothetical protein LTR62_001713 [Meristemomyces frigidus]